MKKLILALLLLGSSLANAAETLYFSALVNVETKETINYNSSIPSKYDFARNYL